VLSKEENELMCRVGPGTVMGDLMRQYWLPFLPSQDLDPDGRPQRMRLLCENLIAFRDSGGKPGLLADNCPHRGASLFFGRNEESGLRCVYHGWKFDVGGHCVDMPNEPPESNFKDKVRATAYPCQERHGMIWAYMGTRSDPPQLPDLEWNTVDDGRYFFSARVQHSNFVQAMEGGLDPSHSAFLHSRLNLQEDIERGLRRGGSRGMIYNRRDKHPHFETLDTDYGCAVAVRRNAEEDSYYWRVNQFVLPFHTMIPPYGDDPALSGFAWVPIDDETTWCLCYTYHPSKELPIEQIQGVSAFNNDGVEALHPSRGILAPPTTAPYGKYETVLTAENDYRQDWEAQKTLRFSGLPGLWPQDAGCQESMGSIYDRSQEHLGSSDSGIIQVRRRLINAARQLRDDGVAPEGVDNPAIFRVRAGSAILPRDQRWEDGIRQQLVATPGVNYPAP
jgi:nitrite reductase/ring-hydroxylating ferredoxin subunit